MVVLGGETNRWWRAKSCNEEKRNAKSYRKPKICFQIFSYLANSLYSFSPKP
jgi:hypothetical protein